MKVFIVLAVVVGLVYGQKEGKIEKRGVLAAPVVAKAAVAPVAYAAYQPQFQQFAYAAPAAQQFAYAAPAAQQFAYAAPAAYAAYAQPAAVAAPAYAAYPQQAIAYAQPAAVAAAPASVSPILKSTGPQNYAQQIPAAAIRNVETVGVTKTITPVVTKTTTYNTHSEPALSVGHVQGYSQSAHGPAKIAPVQYNTVYTQYLNPTVGVNGPVLYSGPATSQGVAVSQGVQYSPVAVAAQPVYAAPAIAAAPVAAYQQGFAAYQPQFLAAAAAPQYQQVAYAQQAVAVAPQYQQVAYAQQAVAAAPQQQYSYQQAAAQPQAPAQAYGPPKA